MSAEFFLEYVAVCLVSFLIGFSVTYFTNFR